MEAKSHYRPITLFDSGCKYWQLQMALLREISIWFVIFYIMEVFCFVFVLFLFCFFVSGIDKFVEKETGCKTIKYLSVEKKTSKTKQNKKQTDKQKQKTLK